MSTLIKKREKREKKRYEEIERKKKRERVRREVKMDKCPTVELGVQDTHLRGKKKREEHLILLTKFQKARKVCIPSKSKSRIRLSPLLSPSSPYTIHSPHMRILI